MALAKKEVEFHNYRIRYMKNQPLTMQMKCSARLVDAKDGSIVLFNCAEDDVEKINDTMISLLKKDGIAVKKRFTYESTIFVKRGPDFVLYDENRKEVADGKFTLLQDCMVLLHITGICTKDSTSDGGDNSEDKVKLILRVSQLRYLKKLALKRCRLLLSDEDDEEHDDKDDGEDAETKIRKLYGGDGYSQKHFLK